MKIAFVSFRLGSIDGVSTETEKWRSALDDLGHATRRVAGEIPLALREPTDIVIPTLSYQNGSSGSVDRSELESALDSADLVVAENVFGLPLNVDLSIALADVLADRPSVGHHHDLIDQRDNYGRLADYPEVFPPPLPAMRHVTINHLSKTQLASRGIDADVIANTFDVNALRGRLDDRLRSELGVEPDDFLILQPTRAIERKNVPRALAFAEALERRGGRRVRLLVTGRAEDGHASEMARLCRLDRRLVHRPEIFEAGESKPRYSVADAYAASSAVILPSDWEGFGNPVLEAAAYGRPLIVSPYPVLDELVASGYEFVTLGTDPTQAVEAIFDGRAEAAMNHNRALIDEISGPRRLQKRLQGLCADISFASSGPAL